MALIFTLIGVFLCQELYASNLRVPLTSYSRLEKETERTRQVKLIREFQSDCNDKMEDPAIFVKKLTHGMFKLAVPFNGKISRTGKRAAFEVEEVATRKRWFLRCNFTKIVENIKLAKRIEKRRDNNLILKRHLPEIRSDLYDTDCYYLTSKEGDENLVKTLQDRRLSPKQILAIGNQIIDLFTELGKPEGEDPGIYFWDAASPYQYKVDLTSNPAKPRVIFVDIGIEGFLRGIRSKRRRRNKDSYMGVLSYLGKDLPPSYRIDSYKGAIMDFFRQHDDGLRPDQSLASNQEMDKSQGYELQEVDTSPSLFTDQLIREAKMSMPRSDEKEPDYTVFNEKVKELKKIKSLDVMVLSAREFKYHKEVNVDYETYKWLNSKYLELWGKKDKFLFHTIQNINQHVKPGIVLIIQQERTTREGIKYTDISVIDNGRGPIDKHNNARVPIEEIVRYGVSKGAGGRHGVGLTHAVMEAADLSIILTHGNTKLIKGGMSVFRVVLFRPAPKILWQSKNEEPYGMTVIGIFCEKKDRKDVEQDVIKRLEELEDIDMSIVVRTKDTLPKFGLSEIVFSVAPLQTGL